MWGEAGVFPAQSLPPPDAVPALLQLQPLVFGKQSTRYPALPAKTAGGQTPSSLTAVCPVRGKAATLEAPPKRQGLDAVSMVNCPVPMLQAAAEHGYVCLGFFVKLMANSRPLSSCSSAFTKAHPVRLCAFSVIAPAANSSAVWRASNSRCFGVVFMSSDRALHPAPDTWRQGRNPG